MSGVRDAVARIEPIVQRRLDSSSGQRMGKTLMSFWHRVCFWGTRDDEIAASWPCDDRAQPGEVSYFRAVDVEAPPARVFRWLCQLKVAPYSYDWIDNLGRRSPRSLTEGADQLASGQRFMQIFTLVDFDAGRFLTLETRPSAWLGQTMVSYQTLPRDGGARLLARLRVVYPDHALGWIGRLVLPLGDWIMMRKQLLTLKALAEEEPEGDVRQGGRRHGPREGTAP